MRTVRLGLANTGGCGPAIGANTRPRGPTLSANEPTLVCEGLANTPLDQHAVRMGSRLEHPRLARLRFPSLGSLQGKRAFCPVVYSRTSPFKSVGMSPKQCEMTFLLDMGCLWGLFAMPVSPVHCLQAIRIGLLVHLQGPQARSSACLQGSLAEKYCCLQARSLLFASHYT